METLLSEEGRIPEEKGVYLNSLIEKMQKATTSDEYREAYETLLQEYNAIISEQ